MDNAELYQAYNTFQKKSTRNVLEEFSNRLSWVENEIVLDIGCGPGDVSTQILLPQLPKDISHLVGVDKSSKMIEFAIEKYSHEKVKFEILDFATKDINKYFPAMHFSKIFSFYCLHWIQDQKQMAQNVFNVLRPDGEFLAVLIASSELCLAFKMLSDMDQFKQYCKDADDVIPPMYYAENPCKDLKRMLIQQGLEVITCDLRWNPIKYPSLEVLARSFEAINPFVKRMPENVKEEYLDTFKELIKELSTSKKSLHIFQSGEVQIQDQIIVVFARRPRQTWSMLNLFNSFSTMVDGTTKSR